MPDDDVAARWAPLTVAAAASDLADAVASAFAPLVAAVNEPVPDEAPVPDHSSFAGLASFRGGPR